MSKPVFIVIAGANGAGKSTLTHSEIAVFSEYPVLDPDVIANTIHFANEQASALAAGRAVLESVEKFLEAKKSFAVETTFSGKNYLRIMVDARRRLFHVIFVYVGTSSVEINLSRIADRVRKGGHHVPESDVRRRFERSFQNLQAGIELSDVAILFDNSSSRGHQLVCVSDAGRLQWFEPLPRWAEELRNKLTS